MVNVQNYVGSSMPLCQSTVKVVSEEDYAKWLLEAKH